jgi:hypothetical protein
MDRIVRNALGLIPVLLAAAVVSGVLLTRHRVRAGGGFHAALRASILDVASALMLAVVLIFVFVPSDEVSRRLELIPFADLWRSSPGVLPRMEAVVEILGNLALFIPLGFLLGLRRPSASIVRVVVLFATFSSVIEIGQFALAVGRTTSVGDVLANTAGGVGGWLLWRWTSRWRHRPVFRYGRVGLRLSPERDR